MSKERRHKERDLYDIYFLLTKGTHVEKDLVLKKLEQSKIEFSKKLLSDSIAVIETTWNQLEPFVAHTLLEYNTVKSYVINELKQVDLL